MNEIIDINTKDIHLSRDWNRELISNLDSMITSIASVGLLNALIVRKATKDMRIKKPYILIDGRRRFAALTEMGINKVKVVVLDKIPAKTNENTLKDDTSFLISMVVNLARDPNTAYEIAKSFHKLVHTYSMSSEHIAKACGKSTGYVSQHLAVMKASDALKKALQERKIAMVVFRLFTRLDKEKDAKIYKRLEKAVIGNKITTEELEDKIEKYINNKEDTKTLRGGAAHKEKQVERNKAYTSVNTMKYKKARMVRKDKAVAYVQDYKEKLKTEVKKDKRKYIQGVLQGIELCLGIEGIER